MNLLLLKRKPRLVFPLVRVDDRLLHGQVVIGWGQALNLAPLLLVSDRVAKDVPLAQTFLSVVPAEQKGEVVTVAEAAERWRRGEFKQRRAMLVVEAPLDALKLLRLGAPMKTLQLGGLHFREDRKEFLPYIFLSEWDRTTLREIRELGVRIVCQDLPSSQPIPYED